MTEASPGVTHRKHKKDTRKCDKLTMHSFVLPLRCPNEETESNRELLDIPIVVKSFSTGQKTLLRASCFNKEEIWTCGETNKIKCFDINGNSINAIKTKSGGYPNDIAVTSKGHLLYCDLKFRTVYKLMNGQIEKLIKLRRWIPFHLCITSHGDLLVGMYHEVKSQYKIVRYCGSIETQTIKYGEDGKPLFSRGSQIKFLAENKNLDICVSDRAAGAVVVVNQAGKLRFRYTGHPSKERPFLPRGITTNSQSQILTADFCNLNIHILNQDGQFLRFIGAINEPCGLCVDILDNLYVAEIKTGEMKVIKYLL